VLPRYENARSYQGVEFGDDAWPGPPDVTSKQDVPDAVFESLRQDLAARFDS
jgi:hypothetical protein